MLNGLAPLTHLFWMLVEPALHGFEHMLVLPSRGQSFLAVVQLCLMAQRTPCSTNKLCVAECGYHLFASLSCLQVREVPEGYYWCSVPIADVETAASETIVLVALYLFNGPSH